MITTGVINGQLASLLARFRHVNTIAIVDGPFPTYPNVETVDLALVMGVPTIPQVLDAILPLLDLTGLYLAAEFSQKVPEDIVAQYIAHHRGLPTEVIPHEDFKVWAHCWVLKGRTFFQDLHLIRNDESLHADEYRDARSPVT